MLDIQNLSAGYQKNKPVFTNFNLSLQNGERLGITGQNGIGKTTLVQTIMGLTPYTGGSILWQGKELLKSPAHHRNREGIGYFLQGGRVLGNLSVAENLQFAMQQQRHTSFNDIYDRVKEYEIGFLNDKRRLKRKAANLSGGERHILGLLMALYGCPAMKLLIADEPSAGVAQGVQTTLLQLLKKILAQHNTALLLVEQNIHFLNLLTTNSIELKN